MSAGPGEARHARHPGTPAAERVMAVPVGTIPIRAVLPAGGRLIDALAEVVSAAGAESGAFSLGGGGFGPFGYVIPGLSPDGSQVAFYSATFRPAGTTALDVAAVTVGTRAGAPFFHCHALWIEADGRRGCGHVLPDETVIAADIALQGVGIVGARFDIRPDPETGFSLFMPIATGTPFPTGVGRGVGRGVALRLAPNQDLVETLEQAGRAAGFRRAVVQGGVGSINEARFVDAQDIAGFATELLVRQGSLCCNADEGPASVLDIAIVDHDGNIGTGRLSAGDNPVLMTFEGVLEEA